MSYTLVTNFYFGRETSGHEEIGECIRTVADQTLRPAGWVFIDDGSNDHNRAMSLVTEHCRQESMPHRIYFMPTKEWGDLDTLGHAWNMIQPYIKSGLFPSDYIAVVDFDDRFPEDYFERIITYLENDPKLGCVAGIYDGRPIKRCTEPQGGGKIVRRSIVESIDKYWDLAPDTFFNIKTRAIGYKAVSVNVPFSTTKAVTYWSKSGQYRYGRRLHYRGTNILLALFIALRSRHTLAVLRGYWNALRSKWQCSDPDVRRESSLRFALSRRWNE